MSKRQIRLNSIETIIAKLPEICGKKVNIVLRSGNVVFAKVDSFSDQLIKVSDMRMQRLNIEMKQVSEVILDIDA